MSATSRGGSYRAVLALPRAAPTFAAALAARLSYGLLPLSLLLTVQRATGSYALAGGVLALLGLLSLTLPWKARLLDRLGQRRVLPGLALVTAACLTATALLALLGRDAPAPYLLLGLVEGLAAPPLGPAMRATWSRLTAGTPLKPAAYGLDSVCEEGLYLLGPVLVGVVVTVATPGAALLVTAALMAVGTIVMVGFAPRVVPAPAPPASGRPRFGVLTTPGMGSLVAVLGVASVGLSLAATGVAARAVAWGRPGAAGWVEAGLAAGSVGGGLLWGARRHRRSPATHLVGLVLVMSLGIALAGAVPGLVLLTAAMGLTGLAVGPLIVTTYLAVDVLAPAEQQTEAGTWAATALNVGGAAGSALAGLVVDRAPVGVVFAAGSLALLAAAALVGVRRRVLAPVEPWGV